MQIISRVSMDIYDRQDINTHTHMYIYIYNIIPPNTSHISSRYRWHSISNQKLPSRIPPASGSCCQHSAQCHRSSPALHTSSLPRGPWPPRWSKTCSWKQRETRGTKTTSLLNMWKLEEPLNILKIVMDQSRFEVLRRNEDVGFMEFMVCHASDTQSA